MEEYKTYNLFRFSLRHEFIRIGSFTKSDQKNQAIILPVSSQDPLLAHEGPFLFDLPLFYRPHELLA